MPWTPASPAASPRYSAAPTKTARGEALRGVDRTRRLDPRLCGAPGSRRPLVRRGRQGGPPPDRVEADGQAHARRPQAESRARARTRGRVSGNETGAVCVISTRPRPRPSTQKPKKEIPVMTTKKKTETTPKGKAQASPAIESLAGMIAA